MSKLRKAFAIAALGLGAGFFGYGAQEAGRAAYDEYVIREGNHRIENGLSYTPEEFREFIEAHNSQADGKKGVAFLLLGGAAGAAGGLLLTGKKKKDGTADGPKPA